jgi:hypothetical protein
MAGADRAGRRNGCRTAARRLGRHGFADSAFAGRPDPGAGAKTRGKAGRRQRQQAPRRGQVKSLRAMNIILDSRPAAVHASLSRVVFENRNDFVAAARRR